MQPHKGSDQIRLVFAHPFPLNNRASSASQTSFQMARFKYLKHFDMATYGVASSYPTNGGSVIQDQRVGTIQSLSSLSLSQIIIHRLALAKQGDNVLGSLRLSVRPSTEN